MFAHRKLAQFVHNAHRGPDDCVGRSFGIDGRAGQIICTNKNVDRRLTRVDVAQSRNKAVVAGIYSSD